MRKDVKPMPSFLEEILQIHFGNTSTKSKGWKVIPVVGRRADPVAMLGEAIEASPYAQKQT